MRADPRHRTLFTSVSALCVGLALGVAPVFLAAQSKPELTPFVGVYIPTAKSVDEQSGSDFLRSKQKVTVVFGSRVGVWVTERVGLEASFGYAPSKLKTDFSITGIGSGTDETGGSVMLINGRLLLGLGPQTRNAAWHFIVGGGAIIRGGDAWSGVDGKTDIGGAVGIGARFKAGPAVSIRADAEDNLYSAKFDISGTESNSKFQNDIVVTLGVAIAFGK